jgi:prepilin-type N-terminal cleavage/methylation domain-containing protein
MFIRKLNKNKIIISNKGFTFVEMMIGIGITGLIILLVSTSFSQNILNLKTGSKINEIEFYKHKIIKDMFLNVINLNSELKFNINSLEKGSVNFIKFSDKTEGGNYSKLSFNLYPLNDIGSKIEINYYLEGSSLLRIKNDKSTPIVKNVENIAFNYENGMIFCKGNFSIKKTNSETNILKPFEFGIFIGDKHKGVQFE